MKKFGLTVASLSLVALSFTACGGDDKKAVSHSAPTSEVKKETPASAPSHETKAETPAPATASAPADPAKLFAKCAGCHGQKAEKKALGQSRVIAGWDAKKIEDALNGYKAGTYGGAMKGVMQGQVAKLNEAKIKALKTIENTLFFHSNSNFVINHLWISSSAIGQRKTTTENNKHFT